MRYPRIDSNVALRIAARRLEANQRPLVDLLVDVRTATIWAGEGEEFPVQCFDVVRHKIEEIAQSGQVGNRSLDKDQLEGKAACVLYEAIETCGMDITALDDPGFWCYLSLAHLWNFIVWREETAFSDDGIAMQRYRPYMDGRLSHECVPSRMYLRVKALGGLEHQDLAWAVRGGTDMWRSHILRVKSGEHPQVVRAVVRRQAKKESRLFTKHLREFAKELTRSFVNIVPALLDDDAADALVGDLWDRQLGKQEEARAERAKAKAKKKAKAK